MKIKQKLFSKELGILLGVCAVPVNLWTIYWTLDLVPSWTKSNTLWGFIGLLAYPLAFALIEILGILSALILLRLIIPNQWGTNRFAAFGLLFVIEFSTFVLLLQFIDSLFWQKKLLLLGFLGILFLISLIVQFIPSITKIFDTIANRLMVLGYFFLIFNLLGVVIVLIRNIS
ncbi:MAG: hypothetical protein ABFS17_08330 [Chloroflexota bacterium]